MKIKELGIAAFFLLILVNFWTLFTGMFWLENTTYILFFIFSAAFVFRRTEKMKRHLLLYLLFTIMSYCARYFDPEYFANEIALVLMSLANAVLIREAIKNTTIKNGSGFMMLYFFLVIGINGCLLGYHVIELNEYIVNNAVYSVYIIYYINLLILGITSFIYYLNSYSRKSMFFISLALGLIFADVLRDMGIFYLKDLSLEIAESILRLGCAVFAMFFFATKEKQLRLASMI